ncbi:hypothetical protein ACROYT_G033883 [Oculina patagonica]
MDFMIFTNSDNLMNREELLEYSFENPLHVRIRGGDHPVLQSCLVDDTEYVATSALKNFCPAIFGSSSSFLVDFLSLFCQLMPRDDLQLGFTARLKNNATSPAVTLNMSQLLGSSIYEYWEMLKVDSLNVPIKKAAAEVEYIVHFLCVIRGSNYTREHAELLNDFLLFMKDAMEISSDGKSHTSVAPQKYVVDQMKSPEDI